MPWTSYFAVHCIRASVDLDTIILVKNSFRVFHYNETVNQKLGKIYKLLFVN